MRAGNTDLNDRGSGCHSVLGWWSPVKLLKVRLAEPDASFLLVFEFVFLTSIWALEVPFCSFVVQKS